VFERFVRENSDPDRGVKHSSEQTFGFHIEELAELSRKPVSRRERFTGHNSEKNQEKKKGGGVS
jgi:hypothetical protein